MSLRVEDLNVSLSRRPVLTDVSFELKDRETLTLIGPNGGGKTTLLNAISGIAAARSGRIFVNGEDVTALRPHQRARKGVARSFQTPVLFPELTVAEAVTLASHVWSGAGGATATPDQARPSEMMAEFGVDVLLDRRIGALSFGQRKLVSLVMAFQFPESLLLLDEPTTGLSPSLARQVVVWLKASSTPMIVVEHNFEVVRALGGRTMVLAAGRTAVIGATEEVLASRELRVAYR